MARVARYVARGHAAGGVAGLAFGLFVAFVGNPLVASAETFEGSHGAGPVPPALAAVSRAVTVVGHVGLWLVLVTAHAWLLRGGSEDVPGGGGASDASAPAEFDGLVTAH